MNADTNDGLRNPPVLVKDRESDRASAGQVLATVIGAGFIIAFVLFGINNQREESATGHATVTQTATAPAQDGAAQGEASQPVQGRAARPQGAVQRNASTTGQGGGNRDAAPTNDNAKGPPPQPRAQ